MYLEKIAMDVDEFNKALLEDRGELTPVEEEAAREQVRQES